MFVFASWSKHSTAVGKPWFNLFDLFALKEELKVLTFSGHYLPGYKGGPIKIIKNLSDQAGDEITFKLIASDRGLGDTTPYTSVTYGAWNQVGNASAFYAEPGKTGYAQTGARKKLDADKLQADDLPQVLN